MISWSALSAATTESSCGKAGRPPATPPCKSSSIFRDPWGSRAARSCGRRQPGSRKLCRTAVFPDAAGRGPMLASEWETPPGGSRRVLASIPSRGPTPITQTLLWSLFSLGNRPEPTKLLILFTDGVFAADDCRAEEATLKLAGIETAAVLLNLHQTAPGRRLFEKETRVVRNAAEIPLALLDVLRDWRRRHP